MLEWIKLYVGDTTNGWTQVGLWQQGDVPAMSGSIAAMFDSTHFTNLGRTSLRVHADWKEVGNPVIKAISVDAVPIKNKALIGQHKFPNPIFSNLGSQSWDEVNSRLGSRYGTPVTRLHGDLVNTQWRSDVAGSNFIWVTTHGTPDIYEMNNGDPFCDDTGGSSLDDHRAILSAAIGMTSIPPFNTSLVPPVNIMFVDACCTFGSDFSWVLWPKNNLYTGTVTSATNQFAAGWNVLIDSESCELIATAIMDQWKNGVPALLGLNNAIGVLNGLGVETTSGVPLAVTHKQTHGDQYAKLAGVYTGNNTATLNASRQL